MSRFKPQVTFMTDESWRDYRNQYGNKIKSPNITKVYDTYSELKKNIKQHIEANVSSEPVFVVRSRKGQWGEWFEHWTLSDNGKPMIEKEGWS